MDLIRSPYYTTFRFFKDDARATKVHWYYVPKGRPLLPVPSIFQHEPWNDENGPRHFMFAGHPPTEQGEQYTDKYGGARPTPLVEAFTGNYCGDDDQWLGELLVDRPADIGDPACCAGEPVAESSWWSEILDLTVSDPRYAHREVTVSGLDGSHAVVVDGRSGTLSVNPAWEGNRQFGVPKGAIVRMYHGSTGAGNFFARGNLLSEVLLAESSPSGPGGLFDAQVAVWDSVEFPGAFAPATEHVWALDVSASGDVADPGPWQARYLGIASGRPLYAFRPTTEGAATCVDCNVLREDVGDITELDIADFADGQHIYIPNTATGAMGHWIALTVNGSRGFVDLCTCSYSWWCVDGACVASAGMPSGDVVLGPYPSLDCCETGGPACADLEGIDLTGTITAKTGVCSCVEDSIPFTWEGSTPTQNWSSSLGAGCTNPSSLTLTCSGTNTWLLTGTNLGVDIPPDPLCGGRVLQWSDLDGSGICDPPNAGTFTLRIVLPEPLMFAKAPLPGHEGSVLAVPTFVSRMGAQGHVVGVPDPNPESTPTTFPAARRALPVISDCIHRGSMTAETRPCGGCSNAARLRIFGCDVHGQCTVDTRPGRCVQGIMSCGECARRGLGYDSGHDANAQDP